MRPSIRRMVRFWRSMKAAETMLVIITARDTWTMRLFSPFGTKTPSTCPVAIGTSAPIATVTRPAIARLRTSPPVPRRLKRKSRHGVNVRSGSGR